MIDVSTVPSNCSIRNIVRLKNEECVVTFHNAQMVYFA